MEFDYTEARRTALFDTECYRNYWSIGFECEKTGRRKVFEKWKDAPLDREEMMRMMRIWRTVGFNSKHYDLPMIMFAASGASNEELKNASDDLIKYGTPWWVFLRRMDLRIPFWIDSIDVKEVSPGAPQHPSLKNYGARLHSRLIQELPVHFDDLITESNIQTLRDYHGNDMAVTKDMYLDLKPQIDLRAIMSKEYGVDVRSKSDAQVAEAVIKAEVERITGKKLEPAPVKPGKFLYKAPSYLRFKTPGLQKLLHDITTQHFVVNHAGIVEAPEFLQGYKITIGNSVYTVGIGGLHSNEKSVGYKSTPYLKIKDRDVTSYYPNIIMGQGLFPDNMGEVFLQVYKRIYDRRLAAKKAGDKNTSETLKIVLNGSFGKMGSPFSVLYGPSLMIQTTLTGQLSALMAIEELELRNIRVISANTDGFVSLVPVEKERDFAELFAWWERTTGLQTEETQYESIYSQNVNSYLAISKDKEGKLKAKRKGPIGEGGPGQPAAMGQKKTPFAEICQDAAVNFLMKGEPIEDTIDFCCDIRKFVAVQKVDGGALIEGVDVGKVARWYYSTEVDQPIVSASKGNRIGLSTGARAIMNLPADYSLPSDIDLAWYYREAYATLDELGADFVDPNARHGDIFGRLPDAKTIHVVNLFRMQSYCGKKAKDRRNPWIEYGDTAPKDLRTCKTCLKESQL